MTDAKKPNIAFWIIGVVALLWNAMGVNAYLQSAYKTEAYMAELNTDAKLALMESQPSWITALFAIAVFTGIIGAILLLMRKKIAVPVLAISFLVATIQQLQWLFGTNATEVFSDSMPYLMPILIIVFGAFWVWYAKSQRQNGVLT